MWLYLSHRHFLIEDRALLRRVNLCTWLTVLLFGLRVTSLHLHSGSLMLGPLHPLEGKQNRWSFDTSSEIAHPVANNSQHSEDLSKHWVFLQEWMGGFCYSERSCLTLWDVWICRDVSYKANMMWKQKSGAMTVRHHDGLSEKPDCVQLVDSVFLPYLWFGPFIYFKDVVRSLDSGKPSGLSCVRFPALAATVPQASTPKT